MCKFCLHAMRFEIETEIRLIDLDKKKGSGDNVDRGCGKWVMLTECPVRHLVAVCICIYDTFHPYDITILFVTYKRR